MSQASRVKDPAQGAPDMVSERIRQMILGGQLEGGTQLRQGELAEQFGTSRIPIREALRYLEAEGLVTMNANRGFVVTTHSLEQVLEMMEIRIALECRALKLAIPNMADEEFAEAEALLDSYEAQADPEQWADINWRFHRMLYAPCGLNQLLSLIEANYSHVGRFMRSQVSRAAGKEQPQKDHRKLLDLCRAEQVDEAVQLMEQHIGRTQRSLAAAMRNRR